MSQTLFFRFMIIIFYCCLDYSFLFAYCFLKYSNVISIVFSTIYLRRPLVESKNVAVQAVQSPQHNFKNKGKHKYYYNIYIGVYVGKLASHLRMIGVSQESLWTPSTPKQKKGGGAYRNSRLACTCTCIYNREQTAENRVNSHDPSHPRPRVIHQDWDISSLSTQGPRLARYQSN